MSVFWYFHNIRSMPATDFECTVKTQLRSVLTVDGTKNPLSFYGASLRFVLSNVFPSGLVLAFTFHLPPHTHRGWILHQHWLPSLQSLGLPWDKRSEGSESCWRQRWIQDPREQFQLHTRKQALWKEIITRKLTFLHAWVQKWRKVKWRPRVKQFDIIYQNSPYIKKVDCGMNRSVVHRLGELWQLNHSPTLFLHLSTQSCQLY